MSRALIEVPLAQGSQDWKEIITRNATGKEYSTRLRVCGIASFERQMGQVFFVTWSDCYTAVFDNMAVLDRWSCAIVDCQSLTGMSSLTAVGLPPGGSVRNSYHLRASFGDDMQKLDALSDSRP